MVGLRRAHSSNPAVAAIPEAGRKKRKTVSVLIEEALARRISVDENGRPRKISVEEIIIRRVVNAAAKGDLKAVQLLLQLRERYRDSSAENIDPQDLESDKEILDAYVSRLPASQPVSASVFAEIDPDRGTSQRSKSPKHSNPEGEAP
jgi:hypothetical protein